MASAPIGGLGGSSAPGGTSPGTNPATDAFGLGFEDLLKIVLTQLTYQDPLKPMDNFEFVSQLAQFSQIQQTQDMASSLQTMVTAMSTSQAAGLLGKQVDIPTGEGALSGKVTAVTFTDSGPALTIKTASGQSISNVSLSSVSAIKEAN